MSDRFTVTPLRIKQLAPRDAHLAPIVSSVNELVDAVVKITKALNDLEDRVEKLEKPA